MDGMVIKEVYEADKKALEERFSRDNSRLKELENMQKEFLKLSGQLTEILKNQTEQLKSHECRIDAIEKRPASWLDRITGGVVAAAIATIVSYIVTNML